MHGYTLLPLSRKILYAHYVLSGSATGWNYNSYNQETHAGSDPFEVDPFASPYTTMHICPFEMDTLAGTKTTMHIYPFEVDPFA